MDWKDKFPKKNRYYETDNGILYHGDCVEIMKQFPEESIDLIVTDPPYKVTQKGNAGNLGGMMKTKKTMKGKIFDFNDIKIKEWYPLIMFILKEQTHFYIMTNHINLYEYLNIIYNYKNSRFIKSIIWNKGNKITGRFYMSQFEYILFCRKGKAKKINKCGTSDILYVPNKKTKIKGKNIHDTEKPIELMKVLIENSSQESDIVLDPFLGSGTTAIACEKLHRHWIGIEIDKKYCEIAKERINNYNKQVKLF